MLKRIFAVFAVSLIFNLAAIAQTEPETTVTFREFSVPTEVGQKYADKGLLFSSDDGVPLISDTGLCAYGARETLPGLGIYKNLCLSIHIGFVSPKEKMVSNFAKNIKLTLAISGLVTAFWLDREGNLQKAQSVAAKEGHSISIPGETDGIFLMPTDPECTICDFTVRSMSFTLSKNNQPICGEPVTDADFSFARLIREDYSEEVYKRLEEYRKSNKILDFHLQYLKETTTYYDEFATIVRLPTDKRDLAKTIFADMRRKLDTVGIGKAAGTFNYIAEFKYFDEKRVKQNPGGLPTVGDIFLINIFGPNDGNVMMTDLTEYPSAAHFRYSTLRDNRPKGSGAHPNNGSREYGYSNSLDGNTKFYVRGIDQYFPQGGRLLGMSIQEKFWVSFLTGIADRVKAEGGRIIFPAKKTINESIIGVPKKCHTLPRKGYGG